MKTMMICAKLDGEARLYLLKSHIDAYTKKDGTFVQAHEDKRVAKPKKTPLNSKDPASIRDTLAHYAEQLGYTVDMEKRSGLSRSNYLEVSRVVGYYDDAKEEPETKTYKIRISDHVLPPTYKMANGEADYEVVPNGKNHDDAMGEWYHAVHFLAEEAGKEMPAAPRRQWNEWKAWQDERAAAEKARSDARTTEMKSALGKWEADLSGDNVKVTRSGSGATYYAKFGDTQVEFTKPAKNPGTGKISSRFNIKNVWYFQGGKKIYNSEISLNDDEIAEFNALDLKGRAQMMAKKATELELAKSLMPMIIFVRTQSSTNS